MIKTRRNLGPRICQGDIIREVEWLESVVEESGTIEVSRIVFPLVVVLTQDCDLEQDHKLRCTDRKSEDKWLMSVLVAPLYNAEHVYTGEHLSDLGSRMQQITKAATQGKLLRQNETPRYHYLEFPSRDPLVPCVIDFKHYFSVNLPMLMVAKKRGFVCAVSPLFREAISHRFASYLARVGLPEVPERPPTAAGSPR